jgi:predicted RNA-binding Zn ribbon-like protein
LEVIVSATFHLYGGSPSLEFVNTVDGMRGSESEEELLGSYPDLVAWAEQVGLLVPDEARRLLRLAGRAPLRAAGALAEARRLREALYAVLLASVEQKPGKPGELGLVNAWIGATLADRRLVPAGGAFRLGWEEREDDLLAPLREVAADAAALLSSDRLQRVRLCGQAEVNRCSWLFLDGTRNNSRRFCSMKGCANRAKARRHYQRVRSDPS